MTTTTSQYIYKLVVVQMDYHPSVEQHARFYTKFYMNRRSKKVNPKYRSGIEDYWLRDRNELLGAFENDRQALNKAFYDQNGRSKAAESNIFLHWRKTRKMPVKRMMVAYWVWK